MIKKIDERIEEIEFKLELVNNWLSNIKNTQNAFNTPLFAESFERKEKELEFLKSEKKYLLNCISKLILLQIEIDTASLKLNSYKQKKEAYKQKKEAYKQKKEALERILKLYLGDQNETK